MKIALALGLLLCLLIGCVHRPAIYAPRRSPSDAHRTASTTTDCLGCHDVTKFPHHDKGDDCFRCHKLCKGC